MMETNEIENSADVGLQEEHHHAVFPDNKDYPLFVAHLQKTLERNAKSFGPAIFRTQTRARDTSVLAEGEYVDLRKAYMSAFPEERRQHYNCSTCFNFIAVYGSLCFIDEEGVLRSAIWDTLGFDENNFFYPIIAFMQKVVEAGRVRDAFKSKQTVWGQPEFGGWHHLHVTPPAALLAKASHKNAYQLAAEVRDDFEMLAKRLSASHYSLENLTKLQHVLEADVLNNQHTIVGPAAFLYKLAKARSEASKQKVRDNLIWRMAASASRGLMHSDLTDNILQMLDKGSSIQFIKSRFGKMTQADEYRRSQAAPNNGTIDQAEKFIEATGTKESLRRRVATIEDILPEAYVWQETEKVEKPVEAGSVFGHLRPEAEAKQVDLNLPITTMSWNKFVDDVLPKVKAMEILIPQVEFFSGFMTAAVAEAPPILVYDTDEFRNPVSTYMKHGKEQFSGRLIGVPAEIWNLTAGQYVRVPGIVKGPQHWGPGSYEHLSEQRFFLIEGAYDTVVKKDPKGIALFPQLLKSDFHPYQSVIEAYSNAASTEGDVTQQVAGLGIAKGALCHRNIRVTTELGKRVIVIDRWE
jgi:hypothetical protein